MPGPASRYYADHRSAPADNLPFVQQQGYTPPLGGYEQFLAKLDNLVACLVSAASDSEVPVVDFNRDFRLANGAADTRRQKP